MTHYYFLIFAFFGAAAYSLFMFIQKRWGQLFRYFTVLSGALLIGVVIFPSSSDHIFHSFRGEEAFRNISLISDFPDKLLQMSSILSQQQFNGFFLELIIVFVSLFLLKFIYNFSSKLKPRIQAKKNPSIVHKKSCILSSIQKCYVRNIVFLSLTISVIATFIIIAIISPMLSSRYFFLFILLSVY